MDLYVPKEHYLDYLVNEAKRVCRNVILLNLCWIIIGVIWKLISPVTNFLGAINIINMIVLFLSVAYMVKHYYRYMRLSQAFFGILPENERREIKRKLESDTITRIMIRHIELVLLFYITFELILSTIFLRT